MKRKIFKAFVMTILGAATIVGVTSCKDKNSNNNDPEIIEPDPDPVDSDPVTPDLNQITGITLSDSTITYDGEAHTIMYEGTLPDGVSSTFSITNQQQSVVTEAKEIGVYTFSYTFSGDGYETLTLNALLTINAKEFEGLTLTSKTVKYTGANQTIEVAGDIPTDASVEYTYKDSSNNTVTECVLPGTYSVIAKITGPSFKSLELNASLVIEKVQATDVVIEKQTALYTGNAIAYDLTALKETYNVELDGYYEDSNLETVVDSSNVKSGLYYVKLRISNDIYEETVKVCEFEIIKNENSYHDVLFTYTYGDTNYEYRYVASPNEVLSDSLIATITADWRTPDDGYEYVYNGSYKYTAITEDTVITMVLEKLTYEVQFVDSKGNAIADSMSIINVETIQLPQASVGDKMVATWLYNGKEYITTDGVEIIVSDTETSRVVTIVAGELIDESYASDYEFTDPTKHDFYIIGYNGTDTELVLPRYAVKNNRVYKVLGLYGEGDLGDYPLEAEFVTSIIIPDSYLYIGYNAFGYMPHLYSVTIPSSCSTVFAANLFDGYPALAEYMYDGDTDPLSSTYTYAGLFNVASFGHSVSDGSFIVTEGDYTYYRYNNQTVLIQFVNNSKSTNITFPETLGGNNYIIRRDAIYCDNEQYNESVILTINNATLAEYALRNMVVKDLILGDNVTITGIGVLYFAAVIDNLYLGSGITSIPEEMLYSAYLNNVYIKANITSIGVDAFGDACEINGKIYFAASKSYIENVAVAEGNDAYTSAEKEYDQTF